MSLIGVDVGSSAVKAGLYSNAGALLSEARQPVTPIRRHPGWWELEPDEVWQATASVLCQIAHVDAILREPPEALAVSASGREVFPVGEHGQALGPCIMAGDTRGEEMEAWFAGQRTAEDWVRACGHLPERMDPALRVLWWRKNDPEVAARARYFLGWHEFLTLRLGGRPVTDRSLAGKWLCYDLATGGWSDQRLHELGLEKSLLPEVQEWGTTAVTMESAVATELGLPPGLPVAVGAFDASSAALGAGASETGVAALLCGSWEGLVVPAQPPPALHELVQRAASLGPHPGASGLAVFALSPNGTAVVDWGREVTGISLSQLDARLRDADRAPSPVLAVPHFSGATVPWIGGRRSRGFLSELTLAASGTDIIKALMEGIACDLSLTLSLLNAHGVPAHMLRVTGGGARSEWWMQLKSDLTGLPLEVVDMAETGTYGAARLAGSAVGVDLADGEAKPGSARRYEPDPQRAALYVERLEAYRVAASDLMAAEWRKALR